MRHNRGQTGSRRSHHAIKGAGVILCEKCGQPRQKHIMCMQCGTYKGKVILDVVAKAQKKADKKKALAAEAR
ncbi:MAG: 50S ribosomal protein L32 [Candidatus Pacebacteria bacterium]|nr:50S ribosomal protein L32 [Candidatus Paceibacterota bacterium]